MQIKAVVTQSTEWFSMVLGVDNREAQPGHGWHHPKAWSLHGRGKREREVDVQGSLFSACLPWTVSPQPRCSALGEPTVD